MIMINIESLLKYTGINTEISKLDEIEDEQLLEAIYCEGFKKIFPDIKLTHGEYLPQFNNKTGGFLLVKQQEIFDKEGKPYNLILKRDISSISIEITDNNAGIILGLKLRDRSHDGKPEASAPNFLRRNALTSDLPPPRSLLNGNGTWFHSGPKDRPQNGVNSIEISIISSNPNQLLENFFLKKADRLNHSVTDLVNFIDDPFAQIPFDNPNPENLNHWYSMWWQVVNRGLRDKTIPQPGQTARSGFHAYLDHVINSVKQLIKPLGFNEISAIPTWLYVMEMFKNRGFSMNENDLNRLTEFLEKLNSLELPHSTRREQKISLKDLSDKHPLKSWFAILPFIIKLNLEFIPEIKDDLSIFTEIYKLAKNAFQDGNYYYPLTPDQNLWLFMSI